MRKIARITIGLALVHYICLIFMVASAHAGIAGGQHPMYENWVSMNWIYAYPIMVSIMAALCALFRILGEPKDRQMPNQAMQADAFGAAEF